MDNDNGSSTICTASDLLPYLARPQIRKKRSTRCEKVQSKLVDRPGLKRPRSKDLTYDAEGSNLVPGNQVKHEHGFSVTHNALEDEIDRFPEASAVHSKSAGKIVENSPAKDGFSSKSVDFVGHHGENEAKGKFISTQNEKFTRVANIAYKELDRSQDTVLEGFCFPIKTDDRPEDSSFPNDSMGINDVHLYAPDTLDFEGHNIYADDRTNVASGAKDITGSMKEELITANMVNSDGLVTESHQEEEIGTSNSNTGSEKSEFDSVGQEMAKLMMTVLLPQAVPLLKESSKKKKETISPCNVLPHVMNSREDNIVTNHLLNLPSSEDARTEQDTRMHIQGLDHGLVVPNLEHLNSVILDSFENSQGGDHVASQAILFSKSLEVNQTSFSKEAFDSNIQEQLVSIKSNQETPVCCGESSGDQDTICHKEVNMAESVLECASPIMKTLSEDIQGVSITLDENSADIENHSKQKKPKNALNCAEVNHDLDDFQFEANNHVSAVVDANDINSRGIASSLKISGNDSSAETRAPTTNSSHQDQNKVYTRKKISKQAYSTRKYVGPLSESIICRNSGDDYAPNNSAMPGTSLVSKSCHSSDDKPCNRDVFGNTPMLEGQSCGLPTEKTTAYCKPEINNMPPILSNENQKLTCASKKDASCLLNQPVSLERGYQENCYKERFIVENGCSALCQNQVTSFCDKNLSTAMEVQGGSGVNHHGGVELSSDLRGIVNLVGGYFHPLPISSVLLGTKGNEIHICVSCGLLVDTDRTLFIYKVATEVPRKGCPSFVGYTSVALPSSEIGVEKCGLQFTPDGQCLVLLDSIKTPYCRLTVSLGCSKENAVKIVRVNPGYVSLVAKLETVESVLCILVCENDYLLAAGKSGRLYLWAMNSTWSAWTEEFIIPSGDCISACVVELKRIPKCAHLVIGHNGFGDFVIWYVLVFYILDATFCAEGTRLQRGFLVFASPGDPIKQFLPISLLSWQPVFSYDDMKERIDEITTSTKFWFSKHKDSSFLPLEGKDVAIWLLVLTNSDAQHEHLSSNRLANTSRCWRLALLVKDTMILGSTLDPSNQKKSGNCSMLILNVRIYENVFAHMQLLYVVLENYCINLWLLAATVSASLDHGIMGRDDGLVYMWELSTGTRLGVLHHFKGGRVSCIATDESRPEVVAVAADDGQLLLYLHNQENLVKK
ncbi:hypothetical protein Goarm_006982 [Gossypium armourianum]|uniref:Uncharacterized protein n=1 Tax=Gossypium armourianum TaxID=34283 RepID=A0A7J9JJR5_9ROSI|nr:hypothetical protein [Gossypium armourianum]